MIIRVEVTIEESPNLDNELLAEYRLDYKKAKPNRFAARGEKQSYKRRHRVTTLVQQRTTIYDIRAISYFNERLSAVKSLIESAIARAAPY